MLEMLKDVHGWELKKYSPNSRPETFKGMHRMPTEMYDDACKGAITVYACRLNKGPAFFATTPEAAIKLALLAMRAANPVTLQRKEKEHG